MRCDSFTISPEIIAALKQWTEINTSRWSSACALTLALRPKIYSGGFLFDRRNPSQTKFPQIHTAAESRLLRKSCKLRQKSGLETWVDCIDWGSFYNPITGA
jgi:hypothetical protein